MRKTNEKQLTFKKILAENLLLSEEQAEQNINSSKKIINIRTRSRKSIKALNPKNPCFNLNAELETWGFQNLAELETEINQNFNWYEWITGNISIDFTKLLKILSSAENHKINDLEKMNKYEDETNSIQQLRLLILSRSCCPFKYPVINKTGNLG